MRQIRQYNQAGRKLAMAGLVLGWIGMGGLVLLVILSLTALKNGGMGPVLR